MNVAVEISMMTSLVSALPYMEMRSLGRRGRSRSILCMTHSELGKRKKKHHLAPAAFIGLIFYKQKANKVSLVR